MGKILGKQKHSRQIKGLLFKEVSSVKNTLLSPLCAVCLLLLSPNWFSCRGADPSFMTSQVTNSGMSVMWSKCLCQWFAVPDIHELASKTHKQLFPKSQSYNVFNGCLPMHANQIHFEMDELLQMQRQHHQEVRHRSCAKRKKKNNVAADPLQ